MTAGALAWTTSSPIASLVGVTNERRDAPGLAEMLRGWGFEVAGTTTRRHPHEAVERTVHWLDGEARAARQ
jgi:hypothetical protein